MAKLKITQVKSKIGSSQRQKNTLEALGLGRVNSSTVKENSPQILGMVEKVRHLIIIEEIK